MEYPSTRDISISAGMECEVSRFRHAHSVVVPDIDDLADLNASMRYRLEIDDRRCVTGRTEAVAGSFTLERPRSKTLPDERFNMIRHL